MEAHEAGLWIYWVLEHEVIAVPRPVMRLEEDRLHCIDGPAVHWPGAAKYFFWKGIQVPERVIMAPGSIKPQEILAEPNAEVRRAMIERYGQDRFMLDAGARVIDKGTDGELICVNLPNDPDGCIVAVRLRCPSTAAVYIIRVPPDQHDYLEAKAWTFGLKKSEYVFARET